MASQGGWGAGSINMFADGRFAMYPIDKWVLIRFRGAHADQVKKGDPSRVLRLGSVPNPHLPGQPPGYGVSARSVMINSRSPHRQDALQFLKYLAGPEYSRLINEGFDALPGNPEYAMLGVQDGVPDLAELEMHQNVMYAMKYGHRDQQSPFLLDTDVDRIMWNQISRMESAPTLPIADLVATAETDLIALMQRNINRSPELRQRYRELTGTDNVAEGHRRAP